MLTLNTLQSESGKIQKEDVNTSYYYYLPSGHLDLNVRRPPSELSPTLQIMHTEMREYIRQIKKKMERDKENGVNIIVNSNSTEVDQLLSPFNAESRGNRHLK